MTVFLKTTLSPSAITSSTATWRPGNARRRTTHTCLSACAPVAPVGTGAWNSTSGVKTSSIVFEMSSASPVFTAAWKRPNAALLISAWAADMRGLLLGW
ncbi:hypothetical protein PL81_11515 [Streptomyces sp. RSD-27]|nr:hypothetical protein PL81_11515 [Streptomyces sp. RSD-27]